MTRDARQRGARRGLLQNRLVPEVQQAEGPGGPAPSQVGKELADGTLAGHDAGGRLSIRVAFPTPGIGYSFVTETAEAPRVQFAAAAADAGAGLGRLLQAAGLVLLLAGLIRLGLLRPLEGRGAGQALALIAACAVGALAIASPWARPWPRRSACWPSATARSGRRRAEAVARG